MRKMIAPFLLAGTLALGGCASGYGADPLGSILGGVLGGGLGGGYGSGGYGYPGQTGGYNNQNFQQAAVNACGSQASRYGQVQITNVQPSGSSSLRVYGTVRVNNGYQQRNFACTFRSDGRISDFDI